MFETVKLKIKVWREKQQLDQIIITIIIQSLLIYAALIRIIVIAFFENYLRFIQLS